MRRGEEEGEGRMDGDEKKEKGGVEGRRGAGEYE